MLKMSETLRSLANSQRKRESEVRIMKLVSSAPSYHKPIVLTHHLAFLGLRRSERNTTEPLEYWRNERVLYKRRDSGMNVYYEKIGVDHKPRRPTRSLVSRQAGKGPQKSGNVRGRSKTRSASAVSDTETEKFDWAHWDEETDPDGIVWDFVEGKETRKRKLALQQAFSAAHLISNL